jgi:uncharacterized protein (DUF2225 family)
MAIEVMEVKRRLMALLNDANMVNDYIRQFGPTMDIKHIKAIKEQHHNNIPIIDEEGADPIYEIALRCPVCNQDDVTGYELRAKSQQVLSNKFLVPIYKGAMGFRTLDYTLLAVTVCPRCLFASPDKKDFIKPAGNAQAESKSQLTSNILMTLQEKIGERKALLQSVTDYGSYFKSPRTFTSAIDSYRLALARVGVEMWYEQPFSIYKAGAYSLRIAKLMRDSGSDNRGLLREALQFMEEAFRTSNCPSEDIEMQVIYTIVALYLRLEEPKKAHSFVTVFTTLINQRNAEMRENPKLTTATMDRWSQKASRLWEDREEPTLFNEE